MIFCQILCDVVVIVAAAAVVLKVAEEKEEKYVTKSEGYRKHQKGSDETPFMESRFMIFFILY